jgi:hypothetical protein
VFRVAWPGGKFIKIPFVFLCVFVLKKVFLQTKKSNLPLETETPCVKSLRIASLYHPYFPKCLNAMWQSHLAARFITARNKKCSVWPGHGRKFTKNPLCVPLCPLCLCVKKVFLQSKKSSVLLRNKNPMRNAIGIAFLTHPHLPKCDVAISSCRPGSSPE